MRKNLMRRESAVKLRKKSYIPTGYDRNKKTPKGFKLRKQNLKLPKQLNKKLKKHTLLKCLPQV